MERVYFLVEEQKGSHKRWQVHSGWRTHAKALEVYHRSLRFAARWGLARQYRVSKATVVPVALSVDIEVPLKRKNKVTQETMLQALGYTPDQVETIMHSIDREL